MIGRLDVREEILPVENGHGIRGNLAMVRS
jgi:hypothetical protein